MNIIEAIKSGKRFKREGWGSWWVSTGFSAINLSRDELLALDWEIEPQTITITDKKLDEAWDAAVEEFSKLFISMPVHTPEKNRALAYYKEFKRILLERNK